MFVLYVDDLGKLCDLCRGCCIILYANDILLIAPTVTQLENLLHILCERELQWLDMAINFKKSCYLRIAPRCDAVCANITSSEGFVIAWASEMRYLGVYFTKSIGHSDAP